MDKVMKTICALSTHASPNYRQGGNVFKKLNKLFNRLIFQSRISIFPASVLAFNSLYRSFREEDDPVNDFTFQLIHSFIVSLCLPSEFGSDSLLIQSTKQAVKHLTKIVQKYQERLFNIVSDEDK